MTEEIVTNQPAGTQDTPPATDDTTKTEGTNLGADLPPEGTEGEGDKEQKPEDKKPEGEEEDKKQKDDKEGQEENELFGKPETYDYKDVKLPENMQLDEAMTGKFTEYASKLNLSQKSANEIMAMAVELTEQTQKQTVEAMGKLQEAKIEGYKVLLNKDSEVGGANLKESLATANLAYDGFFQDEDLRVMLADAGLTVHPKFIKALKSIGVQMKDDSIHTSGQEAASKRNREDILYSSMDDKE